VGATRGETEASFGALLREYRVAAELSQEALAEKAHMSARGISDLERGVRRKPHRGTIGQLARALDLGAAEQEALEKAARLVRGLPREPAAVDEAGPGEVLLATKLTPPPARPQLVTRRRLLDRLEAGLRGPLTLLAAPAGSGKTTLLSDWFSGSAAARESVGWLSLDERDNDPVSFWRYVIAALEAGGAAIDSAGLGMLCPPEPAPIEVVLTSLLNALSTLHDDVTLVLDDYHLIDSAAVHQGVAFLLEHHPARLHIAISTRADPPLPLARLRASGRITEMRAEHLRFSREEATEFLTEVMGLPLTGEEIALLEEQTEGWIAGLQLAALSLQGHPRAARDLIASFAGSHRHVIDYLTDDVLARLPAPVHQFLLHTSILDRLSAPLCAFVMDEDRSAEAVGASRQLLEELERANLFLVTLDEEREWYRYHHLFAEALHHRFRQLEPERVEAAHLRASRWFEDQGLLQEAVEYALDARSFDHAARLLEEMLSGEPSSSLNDTLGRLLDRLPRLVMDRHPVLGVAQAWRLIRVPDFDGGERWLDAAQAALKRGSGGEESRTLRGEIAAARAFSAAFRGSPAAAITSAEEALHDLGPDNFLALGWVHQALARAYRVQGEMGRAIESYAEAAAITRRSGNAFAVMRAAFGLSHLERRRGGLGRAAAACRQAIAWSNEHGHPYPGVGMVYLTLADVLREWNDLDAALSAAQEGATFCARIDDSLDAKIYPRFVLARIHAASDRSDAAMDLVREALAILREAADPARSLAEWQAHEAQLWLQQGDLPAAARAAAAAARERSLEKGSVVPGLLLDSAEFTPLTQVRALIAEGGATGDSRLLQRSLTLLAESRQRIDSLDQHGDFWAQLKTRILQALAHHALDEPDHAGVSLEQALAMAQPEGYIRIFADEGAPMATLLREVPVDEAQPEYTAALLRAISPTL
jgi:LuxR family maltose regulon positive regulatory protein